MCNESLENIYQNTMQDNEQYKEVNIDKEKIYFVELNNSESVNVYYNTNTKQDISISNRTSRTVPNILKSNSKLHQIFKTDAAKSNCFFEGITDTKQVLVVASDHTVSGNTFAKEIKHKKVSRRRKQKLNYVNTYNEPNWNIFSFVDKEKEMLDKNICMSTELESYTQEKKLKYHTNKQDKKQRISVPKNDEERSSMSDHTLTDFTSECQIFSSFEGIDSNNLQNSIDFSSNEIFNKFNYEFYDSNNLDCCTKYIENSDNTYSFSTKYDSNYIKECDINDNKIDTSQALAYWSLTNNEQSEIDVSIKRSMMAPEYWNADLSNKKTKCSSNSYCDYCLEDCVSNWIATSGNSMFKKDRLLTETFNDDSEVNLNNSDLHTSNGICLTDNEDSSRTFSPINEIENSLQITNDINSALTEFLSYSNEKSTKGEIFKEKKYIQMQEENNVPVKNLRVKNNKSKSVKKRSQFQCLSCSLTFSSARTVAIHQAGAHGGMYIILCESCGRLFNRKYHFNRHFIHCGRTKEPFKCDMCFRKYRHKSSLVHHLKEVHEVCYTHSKKFTCSVCQKVYSKFGAFQNHVKSHKNAQ